MRGALMMAIMALALAGCASFRKEAAPVCDGKGRRPANPYGSVLAPAAPPAMADKLSALTPASGSCAG